MLYDSWKNSFMNAFVDAMQEHDVDCYDLDEDLKTPYPWACPWESCENKELWWDEDPKRGARRWADECHKEIALLLEEQARAEAADPFAND